MQQTEELVFIIQRDDPKVDRETALLWAGYLQQLSGCHLFSAASPENDKEEWLRQRTAGIGGSEIATILGENHWSSPRQVWMSKLGMFDGNSSQSEPARWGNLLETVVATEWGIRNNRQWIHIPVSIQDDAEPWLLANIDGFTLTDDRALITGILEVKTTSAYNLSAWEEGPLPFNYICQTMWYCGITHLSRIDLVCLVGGQKLFGHELPFDTDLFEREKVAAREFWLENVQKGIEPPATEVDKGLTKNDEHDATLPPVVFDDDESERVAEAYVLLRDKLTSLKKIKDALYAQLFILLGSSTQALTRTHTMVLQTSSRRNCDLDRLADEYPEAYEDCVTTNVSTQLNIK